MGPQRSSANDSFLPSARNRRPVFSSSHTAPADGASIDGGVISSRSDTNPPAARIRREDQRPSVRPHRHEPRIGMDELHAAPLELHVAGDRRPQRTQRVREGRRPIARCELLARRAAADDRPPLEHERLPSGLRKIEGGDERVVAASDDDCLTHFPIRRQESGGLLPPAYFLEVSLMIRIAAFRPGAPMMPPPGWVADPHM